MTRSLGRVLPAALLAGLSTYGCAGDDGGEPASPITGGRANAGGSAPAGEAGSPAANGGSSTPVGGAAGNPSGGRAGGAGAVSSGGEPAAGSGGSPGAGTAQSGGAAGSEAGGAAAGQSASGGASGTGTAGASAGAGDSAGAGATPGTGGNSATGGTAASAGSAGAGGTDPLLESCEDVCQMMDGAVFPRALCEDGPPAIDDAYFCALDVEEGCVANCVVAVEQLPSEECRAAFEPLMECFALSDSYLDLVLEEPMFGVCGYLIDNVGESC